MNQRRIGSLVTVVTVVCVCASVGAAERLGRGLVAVRCERGGVFLSWRLMPGDSAFQVMRREPGQVAEAAIVLAESQAGTNFFDTTASNDQTYIYDIWSGPGRASVTIKPESKPYLSIPLRGDYDFQKVGVGDLDGDGTLEYVIKQPNFNTDPYQKPGYWKRSTTTYKLEAYKLDGTMLWRHDMGWSIEAGIWYSPWLVYDVDGDGRAEVYCKAGEGDPRDEKGLVQSGPEYLVKLDGRTGKVVAKTDWISRDEFSSYNYYCRNFLTVAYLDGMRPSLVMQRGTYRLIKMQALDKDFKPIWSWNADQQKKEYRGQSSHGLITADVDGDGRDELVMGAAVIDDMGKGLWSLEMGHPDICHVADIAPDNPGLEIFYGFETRQETDGMCVVDAKTGRKLWTHKEPTFHLHGQGMIGDILAEHPGIEVYSGERDYDKRWLYSASGELIQFKEKGSLNPRPLWWDADPQKEVIEGRTIRDWGGQPMGRIEGRLIAVMDCLGDCREEAITALKGELRIYTTTIPTRQRRRCLLLDHQYRMGLVAQTMGYYYPAQLGLASGTGK